MKLGAVLPHNEIGTDPGAMRAFAEGVEALGFSHLLIYDHVLGVDPARPGGFRGAYDKDTAFHEPMTTFAFIAAVTRSIELATCVLILPQRQTALVAKQAAEVDILSGGRFRLEVGTGWNDVEYEALGIDFAHRGARQEEQVELLRKLWTADSLTFKGQYHTVSWASINPRPQRPIPIWFGGGAPVALKRCARLGDGWHPLMGPNDKARAALDLIRTTRSEAGLSMDGFGVQAQAQVAGGDPERWQKGAQRWAEIGATHLAVASHNAGLVGVDAHLEAMRTWRDAVGG